MRNKVLVTGSTGQLGRSLQDLAELYADVDFTFADRTLLDLAVPEQVTNYLQIHQYDYIINCGAYTAVDKAEQERDLAELVNHHAVAALAQAAKAQAAYLIHISTDYVFDGCHYKPYAEDHPTAPVNNYGQTKLNGELAIQLSGANASIVRTSWVYSEHGNNFVKTMLRLGRERDVLTVIDDQVGSPTYAADLAAAIMSLIQQQQNSPVTDCSLYHYSNEGVCSWYDFAKAIFELAGVQCDVMPIETKDYPTPAARPHYSLLSKQKFKNKNGESVPYWRDSLAVCLKKIKEESYV
jgi:dTDP-4-dehydrorhamnose reductase